jgi:hypothetical protein
MLPYTVRHLDFISIYSFTYQKSVFKMKQFKSLWTMVTAIAVVLFLSILTQCQSPTPPTKCELPAPNTVRVDSFTSNRAYISWTQVAGNNGYRIRITAVDSPPSYPAIIDTTVAVNDTTFVGNLLINKRLQVQVNPVCPSGLVSPNNGSALIEGIVIVDKTPLDPPCEDETEVKCYTINQLPASVGYQKIYGNNKLSFDVFSFLQNPPRYYHFVIYNGNVVVSDFKLIQMGSSTANTYFFAQNCKINPPNALVTNYNPNTKTYTWNDGATNVLKLQLINSTNQLRFTSLKKRTFLMESSRSYSKICVKP